MGDETIADIPVKFDEFSLKDNAYGFLRRGGSGLGCSEDVPKVQ